MRQGWALGFTLYVAFFALTIGLRWGQLGQPYREFQWITAHSQIIVDNWLENGFWNERGISFWNPPSIEFPSLVSRTSLYFVSLRSATTHLCPGESFGVERHPRFLSYLGAGMA